MARDKTRKEMAKESIRKLTKSGEYSYYALLPPEWIRELNWKERQKLVLKKIGKRITIQDWKRKTKNG
jgi:hypothetical protein